MDELKKKFENKEVSTADFVKSLRDEVLTEEAKEVLKGRTDGTFSPKDMTKRSEIVVVIYRLMNLAQN